jgi:hypothetical protein
MPLWAGITVAVVLGGGMLLFAYSRFKAARKRAIKELRANGELLPYKEAAKRGPALGERRSDAFRYAMTRVRTMRFNMADLGPRGSVTAKGGGGSGGRRLSSSSGSGRGRRVSGSAPAKLGRSSSSNATPRRSVGGRIPSFEELGRASTGR